MSEKPIIMSGDEVRAILDGRKTQTRRIVEPQPENNTDCPYHIGKGADAVARKQPYRVGDVLWVRETWREAGSGQSHNDKIPKNPCRCYYAATDYAAGDKWRPSVHMPRWAARLFLRVKSMRVERLQDISEEDAKAEGVKPIHYLVNPFATGIHNIQFTGEVQTHRSAFEDVWRGLYDNWEANPWVWRIEFERLENYKPEGGK